MSTKSIVILTISGIVLIAINLTSYIKLRQGINEDVKTTVTDFNLEINKETNQSNLYSPTNLRELHVTDTAITLAWSFPQTRILLPENSDAAYGQISGFRIYRDDFDYTIVPGQQLTFTDKNLYPGEEYRYKVAALTFDNKIQGKISTDIKINTKANDISKKPLPAVKKYSTYLAEGDSITAGQRAVANKGWVDVTAQKLEEENQIDINNFAQSGSLIEDVQKRIKQEIDETNPDLVTLAIGINDITGDRQWKQSTDMLDTIITDIKPSENRTVVLLNIYLFKAALNDQNLLQKVRAWNKSLRDLAYTHQVVYADVFSDMEKKGGQKLLDDLLHPNTEGHRIISETIIEALNE